jgi:hypothetical protein
MGSQPKVIIQKVIAMMNIVVGDKWQSYIIFEGHVMDHGQKVHLHFIKTKEKYQQDSNNAHSFVLFQFSPMSNNVWSWTLLVLVIYFISKW